MTKFRKTIPEAVELILLLNAIHAAAATAAARSATSHPLYSTIRSVTRYMLTGGANAMSQNSSNALAATNKRAAGSNGSGIWNNGNSSSRMPNMATVMNPTPVASNSAAL